MFGFSSRRMKLGRVKKVQLSESTLVARSPARPQKRANNANNEVVVAGNTHSDELDCHCSSAEINSSNWMVLSISGDKPAPRFNHAATVIGNKMIVVGGESGNGLLDDVQVLNFDQFTWTTISSKLYLSPSSMPLKIPACKGHSLVSWGKKALLIGGKTDPPTDRISVWAFDVETECWSLLEAKGDVPVARSGHTVVRASSVLILFGGEDSKKKKLNDLHMFDLKSLTWLPLNCTGTGPSPRSNHVAALYDDKTLLIFGGTSKSRTLNDLYSLDFETMVWSRIKIRGFHPSPRAGCCGVLCGTKWYIAGGGSRKKRHSETLIFDILKMEWSVAFASSPSSVASNKGFSLVLVQHKEKDFLVAFGGSKKEPSNQVEVISMDKHDSSMSRQSAAGKLSGQALSEKRSLTAAVTAQLNSGTTSSHQPPEPFGRQNSGPTTDHHGSGRKSLSETLDPNTRPGNISLRKQFHEEEEHNNNMSIGKIIAEDTPYGFESENPIEESEGISGGPHSNIYQLYETKISALVRKNGLLEGQLAAALTSREAVEKNLSGVLKSKQEMEKKLGDTIKEVELLKEKLASVELAQEEANSLSNMVHSDNVRLEHDVAFLKAVLDDTQKELHSTRGVLTGERARAFQLQVEVFHLKQRLQSLENRVPTPRKPFNV